MKRGRQFDPHLAGPQPVIGPPQGLGAPSFSERLMRALELKGLLPNFLRPGFSPVIIAGDLTDPEYKWLSRERMYHNAASAAATAANNQIYQLGFLTANQDQICIVDSFRIYNREVTAQLWGWYITTALLGGTVSTRVQTLDGRADGPSGGAGPFFAWQSFPTSQVQQLAAVQALPAQAPVIEVPAGQAVEVVGPWVLGIVKSSFVSPPAFLNVHSLAVNVGSSFLIRWRERPVQSSELS